MLHLLFAGNSTGNDDIQNVRLIKSILNTVDHPRWVMVVCKGFGAYGSGVKYVDTKTWLYVGKIANDDGYSCWSEFVCSEPTIHKAMIEHLFQRIDGIWKYKVMPHIESATKTRLLSMYNHNNP